MEKKREMKKIYIQSFAEIPKIPAAICPHDKRKKTREEN